jgi:CysZ protein
MSEPATESRSRPGFVRRLAAGAWHVPAGFGLILRHPRLWPLAALPVALAVVLMFLGAVLGAFLIPRVEAQLGAAPGTRPVWIELPASLLLWTAMVGTGVFLGLGIALLLAAPALDRLSRQVELRVRGVVPDSSHGMLWELAQALRGGAYFLLAAPGVFLLGLIPLIGPFLSVMWGGRAVAYQMTDPALTRRGMGFKDRWRWHREWLAESQGFGLAGMVGLLVPLANLLLGPALVAGGTLLVLALEPPAAGPPGAESGSPPGKELIETPPDEGGPRTSATDLAEEDDPTTG